MTTAGEFRRRFAYKPAVPAQRLHSQSEESLAEFSRNLNASRMTSMHSYGNDLAGSVRGPEEKFVALTATGDGSRDDGLNVENGGRSAVLTDEPVYDVQSVRETWQPAGRLVRCSEDGVFEFDDFVTVQPAVECGAAYMVKADSLGSLGSCGDISRDLEVISLSSRTSSVGSDSVEHIPPPPPPPPMTPDFDPATSTPRVTRRSSNESTCSSEPASLDSFRGRRRHSHPIVDFTHKIHNRAKKILGKISHLSNSSEEREVLEIQVKKEQILPIDPVEAEQTRNIIDAFLNEGQVIATTEIEVLDELQQVADLEDAFDGAREEYASLVATASEALHDFQDPREIANILSQELEECLPAAANPANEMFVKHFLAQHGRCDSLVEPGSGVTSAGSTESQDGCEKGSQPGKEELRVLGESEAGNEVLAKPSSPLIAYRYNVDSPYNRIR